MTELTCIVCPNGCTLSADMRGDTLTVTGGRCKRGEAYAKQELTCPMRTVTTTVRVREGSRRTLPVRLDGEIPRERMTDVVYVLKDVEVSPPVTIGTVVVADILHLGVNVIATDNLPLAKPEDDGAKTPRKPAGFY